MKQTTKKLLSLLLTVTLLLGLVAGLGITASAETVSGDCGANGSNVTWSFDTETGKLTITGAGEMDNYDYYNEVKAPWSSYQSSIKSVIIESGITNIGSNAFFYCDSLTSVNLPNTITSIGNYAFQGCSSLTSVTFLPIGVTRIGKAAFAQCNSLTSIIIPDSVTSIEESAFSFCSSLTSISIPDSVKSIEKNTFSFCESMTSIFIPDSVTSFSDHVFVNCDLLTIYCEATERPDTWNANWNDASYPVVWEHQHSGECQPHNEMQHITNCVCGIQYADHTWNDGVITAAPTQTATGMKTFTCTDCGETKAETLSMLPETTTPEATAPETTTTPEATAPAAGKGSCNSSLDSAYAMIALVAILGFACVAKKKENN